MLPALIAELGRRARAVVATPPDAGRPDRRRSGLVPASGRQRVREHRAGPPRDLRALRDRAVDGHEPRRGRHDGADLVEAVEDRPVVGLRAVPACSPTATRSSAASRPASDAPRLLNATLDGRRGAVGLGRAQPPHARQRESARHASRRRACQATISLQSAIVCPLYFNDTFIGCLALYHIEPNRYTEDHRRLIERVGRAGRRRDPQLDRLRADAGRLADRSADRRCRTAGRCSCTSRASWRAPSA